MQTDLTGRCFISYRRTHADDVSKILGAMLDHGVPPWQDRRDLSSEPLVPALQRALESPDTSGCLIWMTEDFATSPVVSRVELPLVHARCSRDPTFFADLWLADGMDYPKASELFRPAGIVEDVYAAWNIRQARTSRAAGGEGEGIDTSEATRVAVALLERRLAKLHERLAPAEPIRLLFNAHAEAGEAFVPGYGIQLNWARHFVHRFAEAETWTSVMLPALANVLRAVRSAAPGRSIAAEGQATLAACVALGRTFREVTGIALSWSQRPSGTAWSLSGGDVDCGFVSKLRHIHVGSGDLAVFVSALADVEAAVSATVGLPKFRAVLSITPEDGSARRELSSPGHAAQLARLIGRVIREARKELRTVERIHLFIAGPAGLAVLVGQLLNSLGPVQTYEHEQIDGVGSYRAAALLTDPPVRR